MTVFACALSFCLMAYIKFCPTWICTKTKGIKNLCDCYYTMGHALVLQDGYDPSTLALKVLCSTKIELLEYLINNINYIKFVVFLYSINHVFCCVMIYIQANIVYTMQQSLSMNIDKQNVL